MRNLKLIEKYLPSPPTPSKKENLNLQENEKTSLLIKVSTTSKLPQPLWKSLKPPTWKIRNFSKNPNSIGKIFNSFEVTRPIKPSPPHEKISIPKNLTPFRKLQSSHDIKTKIKHPENISPPKKKSFKSPEQTQHHENNLNLPEKLFLLKNSIIITETISNTRTKSQPLLEKSQPLVKNSQSLRKKSQPPTPYKFLQPSLKMS